MPEDAVLHAERAHLSRSRDALKRMHDASSDWQSAQAGDHVSTQVLRQALYRRRLALRDDPDVPLFFGRIDYTRAQGAEVEETCHIGRRHVADEAGAEPLVIDWRAPVAQPFYRAHAGDPQGVASRRRFGFARGSLTAYEDENLAAGESGGSALLEAEIERPRSGPMRDIVATIQPDQDVLVRADLADSLCIQGAPGTGKTAVGLHRAAYLLYAYRDQLSRQGVLVVGPNDSFLGYIGDVLPALGEIDARQHTVASLVSEQTGVAIRADEPAELAVLKGDPRMAELIERAVWGALASAPETLSLRRGSRLWRVPGYLIDETVEDLRARGVRYEAGRQLLPQRLAHQVLVRMELHGESTDDRTQASVARTKEVKAAAKQVWPAQKATAVLHRLLTDPRHLAALAEGLLTAEEQALLQSRRPGSSPGAARWSLPDVVLLDEVTDRLTRTPSLGHVIVDEAQDLSAMMLRAVGRRASTGSVTLLGDLAQATTAWASSSWSDSLAHLGKPESVVRELVEGFRVPGDVIDYAARLLPSIAPGLTPPRSIRHSRGELELRDVDDLVAEAVAAASRSLAREGTVGLIVADAAVAAVHQGLSAAGLAHRVLGADAQIDARLELVPATLAKGLEFDHVVLGDPEGVVEGEPDRRTGLRRLYVCLTRAVSSLVVLHVGPMPAELAA